MSTTRVSLAAENTAWIVRPGNTGAFRGLSPHWNSSLLLNADGEDIQLQIMRATWGRIGQKTSRPAVMFLPVGSSGIALFGAPSQALEPDFYRDFVAKIIRKLLYPSRFGKKRNPPRCRHNPDGPGCG